MKNTSEKSTLVFEPYRRRYWRFVTDQLAVKGVYKGVGPVVSIDNFSFTPMDITISAGQQVTWTNKDDVPHTVVEC